MHVNGMGVPLAVLIDMDEIRFKDTNDLSFYDI